MLASRKTFCLNAFDETITSCHCYVILKSHVMFKQHVSLSLSLNCRLARNIFIAVMSSAALITSLKHSHDNATNATHALMNIQTDMWSKGCEYGFYLALDWHKLEQDQLKFLCQFSNTTKIGISSAPQDMCNVLACWLCTCDVKDNSESPTSATPF